ncbi:MAG: peptidoglycan editing factor PgeF [Candidatus Gracilibacteria bacterium]|nr:peptidoglycan editing factor PgeF [Candidatus Gracilibacteria bacterium]
MTPLILLSQKQDASMKIELVNPSEKILENRSKYFLKNNINPSNVVSAEITNSNKVAVVNKYDAGKFVKEVDGLITNNPDLILSVTIADCVPIYFYDDIKKVFGIAHAGWRGITCDITKSMIDKFVEEFDSKTSDIKVYVGAHIQKCHFEIKEDIIDKFYDRFLIKENSIIKVDLLGIIRDKLEKLGVKSENISSSQECTYCESEKYFSYRRDKPEKVEAMIGVIGIR